MDTSALAAALRAVDPGIVLVSRRVLRRVIKRHRHVSGAGLDVPHADSYVIPRVDLFRLVEPAELGISAVELPESVILLPIPDGNAAPADLWRPSFHASVHRVLDRAVARGALTPAAVRARIHRIGQTEFDEIRVVLRQDHLLLPPHDDVATYTEFAATYLELRCFAPDALGRTFPALGDFDAIDQTLAMDLDRAELLAKCRPPGAKSVADLTAAGESALSAHDEHGAHDDVVAPSEITTARESPAARASANDDVATLLPDADRAQEKGNLVRAILLRARAAAIAPNRGPHRDSHPDPHSAERATRVPLALLMTRLAHALEWDEALTARWVETLIPLVRAAPSPSRLPWNTEARLLYDLQNACIDSERESYTVDLVTWIRSGFKRPLRRALPSRREVRVVKRLRSAQEKMPRTKVAEPHRSAIAHLLRDWVLRAESNLRAKIRPRILAAFAEVKLLPESLPEEVASNKVVGELVDQIVERGFLSLPQLRDALSRNNLKMNNLTLRELFVGDAILKADVALSIALDGVYRRGEIYLRGLQKLSSLVSGTRVGRVLALYLILPCLGAFVGIEGFQHMLEAFLHFGFQIPEEKLQFEMLNPWSFAGIAVEVFLLMRIPLARKIELAIVRVVGKIISGILFRGPRWILTRPAVTRALASPSVLFLFRFFLKPLALTALVLPFMLLAHANRNVALGIGAAAFVALTVLLNTRAGARAQEALVDVTVRQWRELRQHILPGIGALIVAFFRQLVDGIDRLIYAVDEYLRFHKGESAFAVVVKATLGLVWFLLTYVIRIYVNLLIEPQVNPIKHFPVVTVAAKIMIPMMKQTQAALTTALMPLGKSVAQGIAWPTTFFLPGFWGFLVWEFKENFKLYRMNRKRNLVPVGIGHHGESMATYLRPGVHSGTIPKVWAKLRRAARKGARSAMKHRHTLHHIEETIRNFTERELVALLARSPAWGGLELTVGRVEIASNRVRIHVACVGGKDSGGRDGGDACIAFEEQSGWLVGSIARAGFIDGLPDARRTTFETALAGFYKLSGVDLVREQIADCLAENGPKHAYDVSDDGIVSWPDEGYGTEIVYPFATDEASIAPIVRGAPPASPPKSIERARLVFRDEPITWSAWVAAWSSAETPRVITGAWILPPRRADSGDATLAPSIAV